MSPFFSFDGIDGTGKSTQADLFCDWLTNHGHEVLRCRDPGTTMLGEALRDLVLHGNMSIVPRAEVLMYMAARAQLVAEVIAPALAASKTVVTDRFLLASVAYQGYGLGLDSKVIWQLGEFATANHLPDITFVLDLDVAQAVKRMAGTPDRLESRNPEYHQRVREGFLREAELQPDRVQVINAGQSIDSVQQAIRQRAASILGMSEV